MDSRNVRVSGWICGLAVIVVAAGVVAAGVLAAETAVVSQQGRMFQPGELNVILGDMVRIRNDDRVTHNVYIDQPGMKFDSGEMAPGAAVTLRFSREGVFAARCAIHPTMHLDITVAKSP